MLGKLDVSLLVHENFECRKPEVSVRNYARDVDMFIVWSMFRFSATRSMREGAIRDTFSASGTAVSISVRFM